MQLGGAQRICNDEARAADRLEERSRAFERLRGFFVSTFQNKPPDASVEVFGSGGQHAVALKIDGLFEDVGGGEEVVVVETGPTDRRQGRRVWRRWHLKSLGRFPAVEGERIVGERRRRVAGAVVELRARRIGPGSPRIGFDRGGPVVKRRRSFTFRREAARSNDQRFVALRRRR